MVPTPNAAAATAVPICQYGCSRSLYVAAITSSTMGVTMPSRMVQFVRWVSGNRR